jgi:hypothetical protein
MLRILSLVVGVTILCSGCTKLEQLLSKDDDSGDYMILRSKTNNSCRIVEKGAFDASRPELMWEGKGRRAAQAELSRLQSIPDPKMGGQITMCLVE